MKQKQSKKKTNNVNDPHTWSGSYARGVYQVVDRMKQKGKRWLG